MAMEHYILISLQMIVAEVEEFFDEFIKPFLTVLASPADRKVSPRIHHAL